MADGGGLTIAPMRLGHVNGIVAEYMANDAEYARYFTPFDFTIGELTTILTKAVKDRYFILLHNWQVAGFYMLRGWDSGYEIPSYGVWISQQFSGRGFAWQTLRDAVVIARSVAAPAIMLKVHLENIRARKIYEQFGFQQTGFDSKNCNLVYHLVLSQ